jgi:hypothetical protein
MKFCHWFSLTKIFLSSLLCTFFIRIIFTTCCMTSRIFLQNGRRHCWRMVGNRESYHTTIWLLSSVWTVWTVWTKRAKWSTVLIREVYIQILAVCIFLIRKIRKLRYVMRAAAKHGIVGNAFIPNINSKGFGTMTALWKQEAASSGHHHIPLLQIF